ncbi:MAG: LamG domain-containing protein, partial [Planctomycetota bacterium]
DAAINVDPNQDLSWSPGVKAESHDVYLGTSFDEVNNADTSTADIYKGRQSETSYEPGPLTLGQTYYWRIDEVNEADGDSPWVGPVWSFTVMSTYATAPGPADGAECVLLDTTSPPPRVKMNHNLPYYVLPTLEPDTTYYWKIDTKKLTPPPMTVWPGEEWSFTTVPSVPITDLHLVGWWKLNEVCGDSATVIDSSGYDHHGTFVGDPQYVEGYEGEALQFDGRDDYVDLPIGSVIGSLTSSTFMIWLDSEPGGSWARAFDFGTDDPNFYMCLGPRWWFMDDMYFAITTAGSITQQIVQPTGFDIETGWQHVAVTINADTDTMILYYNGAELARSTNAILTPSDLGETTNNWLGRSHDPDDAYYLGSMDDFRIYDYALSPAEIDKAMRGDPRLAWNPKPANGSTSDVEQATPLSWSPGVSADQHDVYLGTDEEAVENADESDTTGIYRGRQDPNTYPIPETEPLEWGRTYYWRIDEYNTDQTISKGGVWNFTTADYLIVDDFEDYKGISAPVEERVWFSWHDGFGYGAPANPPYYPGNGTGAGVGDLDNDATYMEESIVNSGNMSMPYFYDNSGSTGKSKYSEATKTLVDRRDWTKDGVKALSLWFQGYPASAGSFTDNLDGTYTVTGSGADITGTSDEFHFAYKQLSGPGTIIAKVESVQNTSGWAKAGIMIREKLDPNSPHAFAYITPDNGVAFQIRIVAGGDSFNTNQTGISAPHWVKLERDIAGDFTAYHSANGSTWEPVQDTVPEHIGMERNVYVGLAVTSNDTALTCDAVFSNVTSDGTGPWINQDIGILSNDPEPMYVVVSNSNGTTGTVYYEDNDNIDTDATLIDIWTEFNIDLMDFQDQGVNLADVNSVTIGFGTRGSTTPGGEGKMYFDDIRLYRPRCIPEKVDPSAADLNSDCVVNMLDLEIMAQDWLLTDDFIATTPPSASGLVGHWPLDDNANDSSGNGNDGTAYGGLQWISAGQVGGAIELNGVNAYVDLPIGGIISSLSDCSIATWVNWSGQGGAWQRIFDFGIDETFYMFLTPDPTRFAITTNGGGSESRLNAPEPLTTDWHHVAVTIDGTSMNMVLYIDGVVVASGSTEILPADLGNTTQNWLGRSQYDVDPYFAGSLDDLRIYNQSLSQAAIAYLADTSPGDGQLYVPVPSVAEIYEAESQGSRSVNLKDYAVLAGQWLDEFLWP